MVQHPGTVTGYWSIQMILMTTVSSLSNVRRYFGRFYLRPLFPALAVVDL